MSSDGPESSTRRKRSRPAMSLGEAYALLGLKPGADRTLVHAAYRRLALRYHPDHNRSPGALERFKELSAAYRVLRNKFRLDEGQPGRLRDECERCGEYAILHIAQDGMKCCAACLSLAQRRPLLPAPPITIASCATAIVFLALALGCMLLGLAGGGQLYYAAALLCGLLSLASVCVVCVTVVYTADPRQLARRAAIRRSSLARPIRPSQTPEYAEHP